MARSRRTESTGGRAPPPPRKTGLGLQAGALLGGVGAVLLALLGAMLASSSQGGASAYRDADSLGAGLVALLTAPEPEWWQHDHGTWKDMFEKARKPFGETEFPKLPREIYNAVVAKADYELTERNKKRLRSLYDALGNFDGVLKGLQIRFAESGFSDHSVGARISSSLSSPRQLPGAPGVAVDTTTATSDTGTGTFTARVYQRAYKDRTGKPVGYAYAILSQAALEAGGGGGGMWVLLTPLLVALAVGVVIFQCSQAAQGMTSLARDLDMIGRGKLDLRVHVTGGGEVGLAQRSADRMAKNLQLIQTTGSGDLDEALEKELDLATQIHQSLRPADPPRVPGYELETLFKPGRDIGGDYFDYVELDESRLALVIADCSESLRGVPAAMVMAMTRAYLKASIDPSSPPGEWLKAVNRRLARDLKSGIAVTALVAVLDTSSGEVVAASAGHRPIVLWRQGKTALINPNGIALGLDIGPVFDKTIEDKKFSMHKNDRIVLHTDGVVSAENEAGDTYGEQRFLDSIRRQGAMNSAAFVNFVAGAVDQFLGGLEQNDDITVFTCKRMK